MSEMVERVARAICGAQCVRQKIGLEPCINKDGTNGPCRANDAQLFLGGPITTARAAIEAMREPTEDMILAGSMVGAFAGTSLSRGNIRNRWSKMITVALKEE